MRPRYLLLTQVAGHSSLISLRVIGVEIGQRLQVSNHDEGWSGHAVFNFIRQPMIVVICGLELRKDVLAKGRELWTAARLVSAVAYIPELGICWIEFVSVIRQVVSKLRNDGSA